jgi:hypothetical protein
MVKRYHADTVEEHDDGWLCRSADYDTLRNDLWECAKDRDRAEARLAEAEQVVQIVRENRNGVYDGTAALMLVRNADSAKAST